MIVSHDTYLLLCSLLVVCGALYWIVIDGLRLRTALQGDRTAVVTRDKVFGSTIGITVALVGIAGVLKFYFLG